MNKGYEYAKKCLRSKNAPKYVKRQCKEFIRIADGKDKDYYLNDTKITQIENVLKILVMPKGLKAGQTLYSCTCGYQWLFYFAILGIVRRDNPQKRKYETAILEICRKNFKTYTVATMFILLFLLEPNFSKFYSVAPDGSLSREVKTAIEETLKASPLMYYDKSHRARFKLLRDYIQFNLTESRYVPLNYSTSRLDGKLPNVFLADEVGALPNSYALEAMRSGQLNILNKLGCVISTKYPNASNPFEDEVKYAKSVLDGTQKDETVFALLYEPDSTEDWMTNDLILKQSNPVALEIPEIWDDLLKKRERAIAMESARENFLTKHCNIIYTGAASESFVDVGEFKKCKVDSLEWKGKSVYVGVDLAMSGDNCAVSMASVDENAVIQIESFAFIPEGRIEEKTKAERCDYKRYIEQGKCFACGYKTVDYSFIEEFVMNLEERFGVETLGIGYDRWNCLSSAQKWNKKYNCVEVRQHSDTLHPATKLLFEKIVNKKLEYAENGLLEINIANARCGFDTNLNRYINKKKSNGKVDMVAALLDALCLLNNDIVFADDDFLVQVI